MKIQAISEAQETSKWLQIRTFPSAERFVRVQVGCRLLLSSAKYKDLLIL